jgi:hypothetical protein
MSITLIVLSVKVVEPTEYGVEWDTVWKQFGNTYDQGRYLVGPTKTIIAFNNTYQSIDYTLTGSGVELYCMSQDGMIVVIDVVSQYKVIRGGLVDILMLYDDKLDTFVKTVAASTFINVCSFYQIETGFLQNRQNISMEMLSAFKQKLLQIGIEVDTQFAELRNYRYNATYAEAVTDKQVAQQQIELLLSQRPVLVTNAQTVLVNANEQALIDLQRANTMAQSIIQSSTSIAQGKYNQWEQYALGFAATLSKLNMSASTFVQTYLTVVPLTDDTNTNQLYVRF